MKTNNPKLLILCTGNSCRSQMAEGILKSIAGKLFEIYSAGSNPARQIHPYAIRVMSEIEINISSNKPKPLEQFMDTDINTVITVCDKAKESCPVFPSAIHRYHWSFNDPDKAVGSEEQVLDEFRNIRDQIQKVFTAFILGYAQGRKG